MEGLSCSAAAWSLCFLACRGAVASMVSFRTFASARQSIDLGVQRGHQIKLLRPLWSVVSASLPLDSGVRLVNEQESSLVQSLTDDRVLFPPYLCYVTGPTFPEPQLCWLDDLLVRGLHDFLRFEHSISYPGFGAF